MSSLNAAAEFMTPREIGRFFRQHGKGAATLGPSHLALVRVNTIRRTRLFLRYVSGRGGIG